MHGIVGWYWPTSLHCCDVSSCRGRFLPAWPASYSLTSTYTPSSGAWALERARDDEGAEASDAWPCIAGVGALAAPTRRHEVSVTMQPRCEMSGSRNDARTEPVDRP